MLSNRVLLLESSDAGIFLPLLDLWNFVVGSLDHLFNTPLALSFLDKFQTEVFFEWTCRPKTLVEFCQKGIGKASIIAFWIWDPSKWDIIPEVVSWLGSLPILCSACSAGIWICHFLVTHWDALTVATKYSTASHKLHAFTTWTLSPIDSLRIYTHNTDRSQKRAMIVRQEDLCNTSYSGNWAMRWFNNLIF